MTVISIPALTDPDCNCLHYMICNVVNQVAKMIEFEYTFVWENLKWFPRADIPDGDVTRDGAPNDSRIVVQESNIHRIYTREGSLLLKRTETTLGLQIYNIETVA